MASSMEPLGTMLWPWTSAVQDTGALVAALIQATPGKKLLGVNEWLSFQDIYKMMAQVLKKELEVVHSVPKFEAVWVTSLQRSQSVLQAEPRYSDYKNVSALAWLAHFWIIFGVNWITGRSRVRSLTKGVRRLLY